MKKQNGKEFYFKDGRLDLSILDESIEKIQESERIDDTRESIVQNLYPSEDVEAEYIGTSSPNILAEMAMLFEEELEDMAATNNIDNMDDMFSPEIIKQELKEFGIQSEEEL